MEEKLKKVKEILKKEKQEQLLKYKIEEKENLQDSILAINFNQLNELYKKVIQKEETIETKIEPITCIEKEKLSEKDKKIYEEVGEKLIKEGKYAVVTMAGGQRNKIRT